MNAKVLPELPDDIREKIDDLLRKSGESERENNIDLSEKYQMDAWNTMPEPKLGWNYYSNIIPRDYMLFYRDTKQFDKCLHWLEITRESYGPGRNESVEFYAATIYFEMGEYEKAFEEFNRQFKQFKKRPFDGEDKKYLEFYLDKKVQMKAKNNILICK